MFANSITRTLARSSAIGTRGFTKLAGQKISIKKIIAVGAGFGVAAGSFVTFAAAQPSTLKITYFPIQGPAEPARLALVLGDVDFEDCRLGRAAFNAAKESNPAAFPLGGQMPTLEMDGKVLTQSEAIGRFCANISGLTPRCPFEQAKVDEVIQFVNQDIRERILGRTMNMKDATEKTAARKKAQEETLPAKFATLEALIGPSGFFVGEKISMADICFYTTVNWIGMGVLDGIDGSCFTKTCPKLTKLVKTLDNHPKIKAWNSQNNPKLPWLK
eukprot:m.27034 g.27034  ORF g.27034 m.27034 type:complete len:273 (+) comp15645_c0_seq1:77-895(+)